MHQDLIEFLELENDRLRKNIAYLVKEISLNKGLEFNLDEL